MWKTSPMLCAVTGEGGGVGQGGRGGPGGGLGLGAMLKLSCCGCFARAWIDSNVELSVLLLQTCSGLGES